MKITKIEVFQIQLELKSPWKTAYGSDSFNEPVLVKMYSGDNFGWGEGSPLPAPAYSSECADGDYLVSTKFIAPFLLGKDIASGEELQKELSWIKGNYFAKAAFDLAWWDMHARMQNKPLWQVLNGNGEFTKGDGFGIQDSIDILLEKIENSVKNNCPRVKLKFAPGWDLDMLQTVRKHFPKTTLHIDCNSNYTLADTDMFKEIDRFNLAMIEQPLAHDDLLDHAKLQKIIKTPICLDESLTSVDKARKAIELKSCRYFNLKPGRVGGITNLLKINQIAEKAGIPCWIGGMLESPVGVHYRFHLSTLSNMGYPSDINTKMYKLRLDPDLPEDPPYHGKLPAGAGISFDPDRETLEKVIKNTMTFAD